MIIELNLPCSVKVFDKSKIGRGIVPFIIVDNRDFAITRPMTESEAHSLATEVNKLAMFVGAKKEG